MSVPHWLLLGAVIWFGAVAFGWLVAVPFLRRGPAGRADFGVLWWGTRLLARFVHHTNYKGQAILPKTDADHDGLIVVSNHTGSVDPLLIQSGCRFWIRWMMASETMTPNLAWLWENQSLIAVDRDGSDSGPLRTAIRHVRDGGALGIFPEGRITMPPREVRPFLPGVGLIVAKTGAPVLVVVVRETPETTDMMESLLTPSHAHIEYLNLVRFEKGTRPDEITRRLRAVVHEATGWRLNDEVLPPGGA